MGLNPIWRSFFFCELRQALTILQFSNTYVFLSLAQACWPRNNHGNLWKTFLLRYHVTHSWHQNHQNIWWSTKYCLRNFVYFIFFAWSKVGLVQKILKRLGKVAWFQYKTAPKKNKGVSQKNQNKNFVKKRQKCKR